MCHKHTHSPHFHAKMCRAPTLNVFHFKKGNFVDYLCHLLAHCIADIETHTPDIDCMVLINIYLYIELKGTLTIRVGVFFFSFFSVFALHSKSSPRRPSHDDSGKAGERFRAVSKILNRKKEHRHAQTHYGVHEQ